MADAGPEGSGNSFIERFLGDLMKVMGGAVAPTGARVDLARDFARSVAGGAVGSVGAGRTASEPPRPDPIERIKLEELARLAELHVGELTGLPLGAGGSGLEVLAVGPVEWAAATVDDWQELLAAMSAQVAQAGAGQTGPGEAEGAGPPPDLSNLSESLGEMGALGGAFGEEFAMRMFSSMAPVMAALQMGSAVGHLAQSALGSYELPIPRRSTARLLLVPANLDRFADDWSLDREELRLWVCVRELTAATVLARPQVRRRLGELFEAVLSGAMPDLSMLSSTLGSFDPSDPDAFERLIGSPEALLAVESSPERRRASAELAAVVAALLGYVDHIGGEAAGRLLGGKTTLREAWRRSHAERDTAGRETEEFFGLDLSIGQFDRGAAFVAGVLERAGEAELAQLWTVPHGLPTPSEIEAPGLWLERVSIDSAGGTSGGPGGSGESNGSNGTTGSN